MITGLSDSDKAALAGRVGERVHAAVHGINDLAAEFLSAKDIHAYLVLIECVAAVVDESFKVAEAIQRQAEEAEHTHGLH